MDPLEYSTSSENDTLDVLDGLLEPSDDNDDTEVLSGLAEDAGATVGTTTADSELQFSQLATLNLANRGKDPSSLQKLSFASLLWPASRSRYWRSM